MLNFIYSKKRGVVAVTAVLLLLTGTALAAKKPAVVTAPKPVAKPVTTLLSDEEQFISLIDRALPSVVSIVGSRLNADGTKTRVASGTGFLVDTQGLIVTNRHVVNETSLTYTAYLSDGRRYSATVLSKDPLNDVAIVRIPGDKLPVLKLGDSDKVRIGQTAIAIGNSLGRYQNTVTRGIVSGLGRSISASDNGAGTVETLDDVIQTDAAINPGNSGGPLLNFRGEVIGINTAIEQQGRGVGFAIPINEARTALMSYQKYQRIVRPYVGLRYLTITPDIQDARQLAYDYGALIDAGDQPTGQAIVPNGPADRAGLRAGNIIVSVNGTLVRGSQTLRKLIRRYQPGDTVTLYVASNTQAVPVKVTLEEVPDEGLK